jgi:hypothetical protein
VDSVELDVLNVELAVVGKKEVTVEAQCGCPKKVGNNHTCTSDMDILMNYQNCQSN